MWWSPGFERPSAALTGELGSFHVFRLIAASTCGCGGSCESVDVPRLREYPRVEEPFHPVRLRARFGRAVAPERFRLQPGQPRAGEERESWLRRHWRLL
jgi:hypothetical protein